MIRYLYLLPLLLLGISNFARAQESIDDQYSLGSRFGALIGQRKLASPPLPSLQTNDEHKINIQTAYIGGDINGIYHFTASDGSSVPVLGYKGYSTAYSGALAYTSPSIGSFSLFAFGIYTQGAANLDVFGGALFRGSKLLSTAGALGSNYVFLGDPDSLFKMGLFASFFVSRVSSNYDYVDTATDPATGQRRRYPVTSTSTDFGPMAGIQAQFRYWKISVKSFLMYAYDITPRNVKLYINGTLQTDSLVNINSSFWFLWRVGWFVRFQLIDLLASLEQDRSVRY